MTIFCPECEVLRQAVKERDDLLADNADLLTHLRVQLARDAQRLYEQAEEIARLRAEIERWKDTLELELTQSQAWVAEAERQRDALVLGHCAHCQAEVADLKAALQVLRAASTR